MGSGDVSSFSFEALREESSQPCRYAFGVKYHNHSDKDAYGRDPEDDKVQIPVAKKEEIHAEKDQSHVNQGGAEAVPVPFAEEFQMPAQHHEDKDDGL
jgi:hypothetical protein